MAEVDIYPVETNSSGVATTTPTPVETQQPGGTGSLRQVMAVGDPTTRANIQTVNSAGAAGVTDIDTQSASLSITANATTGAQLTGLNGVSTAILQLTGTWVATLNFQVTVDGTNWVNINGNTAVTTVSSGAYVSSGSIAANGIYQLDVSGCVGVRVITITYTSGTVNGAIRTTAGTGMIALDGPLPPGANTIGALSANQSVNVAQINSVTPLMGNGSSGTGAPRVTIAADSTGQVAVATRTTGGATTFTLISAATTNATNIKSSAGTLYTLTVFNNGAAAAYFKLYNKATAPTVGSDTPVGTFLLPSGGGFTYPIPDVGLNFSTGIAYAITGGGALADTTAVAATQVFVNGSYA